MDFLFWAIKHGVALNYLLQLYGSRYTSLGNTNFLVECCCWCLMRQMLNETALFSLLS